jgi:stearoyl-CoA desaturase (delta-9 desaturase)
MIGVPPPAQTPPSTAAEADWGTILPIAIVHLAPLGALWTGVTAVDLWLCAALYIGRMFCVTAGYHRLLAHRAYRTHRPFRFLLLWGAVSSGQGGPLWWAGWHRHHHNHSDTNVDIHSPRVSFWQSHIGWLLTTRYGHTRTDLLPDLAQDKELLWLNRWHWVPPLCMAALVWALFGLSALLIGVFLSTALLYHGTFFINSLAHCLGRQRYSTHDDSRNSALLAVITLGEGWHNNHHHRPSACRQGVRWWELDVTWMGLKILSWMGLVWGLREHKTQPAQSMDDLVTSKHSSTPHSP